MRWKPLVGLLSPSWSSGRDSRGGKCARPPVTDAARRDWFSPQPLFTSPLPSCGSLGEIHSLYRIPCTFVVINFFFFFLPYFFLLFFFDEIQRSGDATCIIKCRRKTSRVWGIILFTPIMVLEVDGNSACSKFCLREEFSSTGAFQEVYDSVTLKNEKRAKLALFLMDSLVMPRSQDVSYNLETMKTIGDLTGGELKLKFREYSNRSIDRLSLYKKDRDLIRNYVNRSN